MTPLPEVQGDGPVLLKASTLRALVQAIRERTPLPTNGQSLDQRSFGYVMSAGRTVISEHPFKVTVGGSAGGGAAARIAPGTVNGQMVTLAGVRLDADPAPELPLFNNGTGYLYLELTFDLTFQDGYLISAGLAQLRIVGGASPLPYYAGSGIWRLHLATISNFRVTAQNLISSLWANCCDGGPGVADLRVEQS